ncbi:type IV toxin-antitoxin system AbiEi family antitoxin domain-containing protein [Microbacterium sp. LMI1x-1-1.1]|uniref:type IV toxin-antitoxin system AbiEi family antitoxin domain-containing protein n=1 Tax=Microbacterium sp. LMI1x-1-1.1 TaxID=3135246 RepID=UPI00343D4CD8
MCELRHPIVRLRQLLDAGWSQRRVQRALRSGELVRVRIGVYAWPETCAEARLAGKHGGALACVTAARHRGLWVLDDDRMPHVWMRPGQRTYDDSCDCTEHWDAADPGEDRREPSLARILRQILTCHGGEAFFVALESARRQDLLDGDDMRWLSRNVNQDGRDALALSRDDADSGLESMLRWRLRELGLRVQTQVRIAGVGVVDALIGDRLIIEVDGRDNHDGPPLRHKDLVRDANAAMWGYVTLRFDYALIVHDWDIVERAILGALAGL